MKRHASMNRAYRLVWSLVLDAWTAVAENARGRGKGNGGKLLVAALMLSAPLAHASPSGGQVTAGQGTITQSGSATTITQGSQNLSLRWDGFNTAAGESVNFVQPSANAIAVNRIVDTNGTKFLGTLNANGQVYLINPNGILFGAGAQVNVGGLIASTLDISDASLSSATRTFSGTGTGSVVNQGTINGRYVALLGNTVRNQGTITTAQGMTALGAGSAVTLTFADTSLVKMQVDQSTLDNLAENGGLIRADGGMVLLTAGAKNALLASVVNNTGVIEARSVQNVEGTIVLDGGASGTVTNSGTLDASGKNAGETGGTVKALGRRVELLAGTNIDVSGDADGGTALIGGNYQGKGPEQSAVTTTIANGASINADAITSGDGGMIVAWSNEHTTVDGSFSARGGAEGGDGGQVETSGHKLTIGDNSRLSTTAPKGQAGNWLLDPVAFTIYGVAESGDMLDTTLNTALGLGSVTIQTGDSTSCTGVACGAGSAGKGDIFVTDNAFISWTTANTLTLSAYRYIDLVSTTAGASFDAAGGAGNIVLRADNTGTGTVNIGTQAWIDTSGGGSTTIYTNAPYSTTGYKADSVNFYGTFNVFHLLYTDTAGVANNKTYDGGTTATMQTAFGLDGTPAGATLTAGTATFDTKNVGTGKTVTFSGYSAGGTVALAGGVTATYYLGAQPGSKTADITPAAITVSGITAGNKTYDGTTSATVNTAGAVFTGMVGGDTLTVSTTGAFANKHVGTGKTVNLSSSYGGADAGNYSFTDQATTTANISAKSVTLTAPSVSKTYDGGTSYAATAGDLTTLAGSLLGGDTVTAATIAYTDKNAATNKTVNLSAATINDGNSGNNYNASLAGNSTSTITAKGLSVAANAASKTYDGLAYSGGNGVTYSGFAAGDTAGTVLSGTLSYGGTSQGAVNPGTFTIVPGGLTSNANYTLSFVDGALTILEAAAPATARAPAPAQQPQTVKDATTSLVAAASQPVTSGPSQTLTVKQLADASSGEGGGSNPDSGGGSDSESGSGNGIGINTQMLSGGLGPTLQIVNGGIRLPGNMVSISE